MCRNGEIDLEELSDLLQGGSSGIDPLTMVRSVEILGLGCLHDTSVPPHLQEGN